MQVGQMEIIPGRLTTISRIAVEVETPRGARTLHAVVSGGGSYGGSILAQEIGLGDATGITRVEVIWPASGIHQRFENVAMDRRYRIIESKSELMSMVTSDGVCSGEPPKPAREPRALPGTRTHR
jgi:ASPIC and UnbV